MVCRKTRNFIIFTVQLQRPTDLKLVKILCYFTRLAVSYLAEGPAGADDDDDSDRDDFGGGVDHEDIFGR